LFIQQPTAQASQDLTNILANLLTNPDPKKIQGLAGLLSTSQQNQLQELLKQVKANDPVSRWLCLCLSFAMQLQSVRYPSSCPSAARKP